MKNFKIFSDAEWDEDILAMTTDAFKLQLEAKKLEDKAKQMSSEAKGLMQIIFDIMETDKIESSVGSFSKVTTTSNRLNADGLKTWLLGKGVDSDLLKKGFKTNTTTTTSESVRFVKKRGGKKK